MCMRLPRCQRRNTGECGQYNSVALENLEYLTIGFFKLQNPNDKKPTLVQVMAWCRQATSLYLSQCWPRAGPWCWPINKLNEWTKNCYNEQNQTKHNNKMSWLSYIKKCSTFQRLSLRWRHNWRDGISNHQPHYCLLNRLFRCRSKKISKLRVTGLCVGNSLVTGEFSAQRASNAENVSSWWRYHEWFKRIHKELL